MSVYEGGVPVSTPGGVSIVDVTSEVQGIVAASGIVSGMALVFVSGATGAITTIEYEPGLVADMKRMLERLFPRDIDYDHHLRWHDNNGHSHIRASTLGPSLTVPVRSGKLVLGTWQQIVFIELDTRPRERELVVQVVGE